MASEKNLDLMLVSKDTDPPVCRILDFGNFKYKQQKKVKKSKKTGKAQVIKEIKMSHKISDHDYQVRFKRSTGFLEKGFKLKVTIIFKGREIIHSNLGYELLNKFIDDLKEVGSPESSITSANRALHVMISPI